MRKLIKIITLAVTMGILALTGCTTATAVSSIPEDMPIRNNPTPPVEISDIPEFYESTEPVWNRQDNEAVAVARGANDFAFRLSTALLENIEYENFVVSPYSVWLPLAALVNATNEEHRPALLEALGAGNITADDINRAAARMLFDLTNELLQQQQQEWDWLEESEFASSPLHIANAIFVDNDLTLQQEFAQTFLNYFRGEIMNIDFSSPEAVEFINQWASNNTNGLINELVQELDPDTVAAIANAIYFSGFWLNQFDPNNTSQDIFYSPKGESQAYFMELEMFDWVYFEDDYIQAVNLRFDTGGGMYIFLPVDGDAVGFLSSMTSEYFERIQENSVLAEGKLLLPRFSIESTIDSLEDALIALGVPLFDSASAPLTNGLVEEDILMWISDAIQVSMIEIDEEGATAAAVTMFALAGSAPIPATTFEMICNTPFAFILHSPTQDGGSQILFMGVVNQL